MRITLTLLAGLILALSGCGGGSSSKDLVIFHAGSLSVPVKRLSEAFEKENPGVRILTEGAGSLQTARKVTELGKSCDIMLSADHFVVSSMLIPEYASWNIRFATNALVIAYRPESSYSSIIREENWADILLKDDVIIGRADPDADPCGYRTVFLATLAEEYYGRPGLADSLLGKDRNYIRPKEGRPGGAGGDRGHRLHVPVQVSGHTARVALPGATRGDQPLLPAYDRPLQQSHLPDSG